MKKAGVVILFNPNSTETVKNLRSYVPYLDKLYVIDNSDISNEGDFANIAPNIEYVANLKNTGIAVALNVTAHKAIKENFDILLTMDQDSYFPETMISKYASFADTLDWQKISMIGCSPRNFEGNKNSNDDSQPMHLLSVQLIITSGSFVNLKLFDSIGGFNEKLFIDCIDYDYCLTSIIKGYKIGRIADVFFFHVGGTPHMFLGRKVALYAPERYYYLFRNHIYFWLKYISHFPQLIIKNILVNVVLSLLPNMIFSKNKIRFISSLFKAISDVPKVF